MLRRFNYTKRKPIRKSDVVVTIRTGRNGQEPYFDIELRLGSYGFAEADPEAQVRLEAWRGNISERWDFGTVSQLAVPSEQGRRLKEAPLSSQFRLTVVVGDGSGRLLGASPPIRPVLPRGSLLHVAFEDIGDEVWKVDFGDGDQPQLVVNNRIELVYDIVQSDERFRSLVMPQVLRSVLTQIVLFEQVEPDDDESPLSGWFDLALSLVPGKAPKVTDPTDDVERERAQSWIDSVVSAFSTQKVHAAELYRSVQDNS